MPQPTIISKPTEKINLDEKFAVDNGSKDSEIKLISDNNQDQDSVKNNRRRRDNVKEEPVLANGNSTPEIENKPERKERSLLSRSLRRDDSKWEKVVVPMTSTEQDVYGFMGVSPLLHLEREFKDPKSVLIYVKLPEEIEPEAVVDSSPETTEIEESTELADEPIDDNLTVEQSDSTTVITENEESADEEIFSTTETFSVEAPSANENVEPETTIAETAIKEALEGDRPVVRTRRRRRASTSSE